MENKSYCNGCSENFYNNNNSLGVKECWHFKKAKLVSRIMVGNWENPPYKNKRIIAIPNCYRERGNNRTHYVSPSSITKEGFWK